jgi:hypothetical protein
MNRLTAMSNYHWRQFKSRCEVPAKALAEQFDYRDDDMFRVAVALAALDSPIPLTDDEELLLDRFNAPWPDDMFDRYLEYRGYVVCEALGLVHPPHGATYLIDSEDAKVYFEYRGRWYHLDTFMQTPLSTDYWDGYHCLGGSEYSLIAIKLSDDGKSYQVATLIRKE